MRSGLIVLCAYTAATLIIATADED